MNAAVIFLKTPVMMHVPSGEHEVEGLKISWGHMATLEGLFSQVHWNFFDEGVVGQAEDHL